MCAENDRRCRWTRTERPTVANVCRKRQNMSLDAQIGEAPRAAAGVFKSAVHPRDTPRTRNRPTTAKLDEKRHDYPRKMLVAYTSGDWVMAVVSATFACIPLGI